MRCKWATLVSLRGLAAHCTFSPHIYQRVGLLSEMCVNNNIIKWSTSPKQVRIFVRNKSSNRSEVTKKVIRLLRRYRKVKTIRRKFSRCLWWWSLSTNLFLTYGFFFIHFQASESYLHYIPTGAANSFLIDPICSSRKAEDNRKQSCCRLKQLQLNIAASVGIKGWISLWPPTCILLSYGTVAASALRAEESLHPWPKKNRLVSTFTQQIYQILHPLSFNARFGFY